uniref:TctD-like protein n=1 Tax=Scinaia undulata TaxID=1884664 RepID=A0A1G4NXQ8_9FLOR|nr:Hypothetical protein ycf29 [Scinaia undulata]SCW23481.1 Hypothetical protein ycf29 [Scinaia undulata]
MCYKVLLVDDDISLLSSISLYLCGESLVVKSASSVKDALDVVNNFYPDIIVSDILMPEEDGYTLIKSIAGRQFAKKPPVIFLTAKGMTQDRIKGYDLGCYAYLTKPFDPEELLSIIKNVLRRIKRDDSVSEKLPSITHLSDARQLDDFTDREFVVLQLVLEGFTNKEIAAQLNLAVRNIEKYVSRLLAKTGTRNRTHLSQYYYKNNFETRANDGNRTRE